MIIKILGGIDISSALAFLMLTFGIHVFTTYLLFCAVLLFLKGLFIFGGDVLSLIDILSAILLFTAIFFTLPIILLWLPSFFLLAKGFVSFV